MFLIDQSSSRDPMIPLSFVASPVVFAPHVLDADATKHVPLYPRAWQRLRHCTMPGLAGEISLGKRGALGIETVFHGGLFPSRHCSDPVLSRLLCVGYFCTAVWPMQSMCVSGQRFRKRWEVGEGSVFLVGRWSPTVDSCAQTSSLSQMKSGNLSAGIGPMSRENQLKNSVV